MKKGKRIFIRAAAIILAILCLLPLCSCFDHNYNWDLPEREADDVNLELLMAALAGATAGKESLTSPETSSEVGTEPPPVDPEPENGLIMTLSLDGGHYIVAGASDTSAVELEIPEEYNGFPVTEIADKAFMGMNKLENISIPDSITRVGSKAFSGCASLEFKGLSGYKYLGNDENPYHVLVSYNNETATQFVNINDSTVVIADEALSNSFEMVSVRIPESVLTIGDYAFSYCSALTEVDLGSNLQYIGEGAFFDCHALESVTIPDSVTTLGSGAFRNCTSLRRAEIGDGIEKIETHTFAQCSALTVVVLGDKLRHIDNGAFDMCVSLPGVTLPESLAFIGKDAFSRCDSMSYHEFNGGYYLKFKTSDKLCLMAVKDEEAELLGMHYYTGVIAYGLLGSLDSLKTLEIRSKNNYETSLLGMYFQVSGDCVYSRKANNGMSKLVAGLNNCTLPAYIGINEIADYAFYGCKLKSSLRLPRGVTRIGDYAFYGCTGLEDVALNTSLESVGDYAFAGCTSIKILTLNDKLQSIGDWAFASCSSVSQDMILPDSLTHIGAYAFAYCKNLTSIEFNAGLEYLGNDITYKCADEMDVYYRGTVDSWREITNSDNFVSSGTSFVYCSDGSLKYG